MALPPRPQVFATGADAVEDKARASPPACSPAARPLARDARPSLQVLSAQLDTLAFIGGAHVGIDESQAAGTAHH